MKREVIKFLYLERIGLLFRHIIYFLLNCSMGRQTDTASYACLCICAVCAKQTPKPFGDHSVREWNNENILSRGNIRFWQAHLCGTPSTKVLKKKIFGHTSSSGFLMSCCYHPKDSLKWVPSPLQETELCSVRRDNGDRVVQPPHILVEKVRLRLRTFSKVKQLLSTSPLVSLNS